MDGSGDGGEEPGGDAEGDPRRADRPEAGLRRDHGPLLLLAAAAHGDDRPRSEGGPRMGRALRPAADAEAARDRHAQSRNDRTADVEAVHARSAAGALPAARDESGAGD